MVHSANYRPGETGNPNGRPLGSRNKRTTQIINQIIASGAKDPLITLSELSNNHEDPYLRAQAANMLAPYMHSKCAPSPAPVYLETEINYPFPEPKDSQHYIANMLYVNNLKITGQIDREWGDDLIADLVRAHNARTDEAKIALQGGEQGDQTIRILGGLPSLPMEPDQPGVIMPPREIRNGQQYDALASPHPVIEHEPRPQTPGPSSEDQQT